MIRRRGAVLTEWAIVFVFVLAPLMVVGAGLYGWMVQSWSLGRALELAGERYATTGAWDEAYLLATASSLGVPIVTGRDTIAITVTPNDSASCGVAVAAAGWGALPEVCSGDVVSITLSRTVGEENAPLGIALPVNATATWAGVAQRDSVGNAVSVSGGSVSGTVLDANGAAIAGASVILEGIATTTTGVDGAFYLGGIEAGGTTSTLRVQAEGYLESATTVLIPVAGDVALEFRLNAGKLVRVYLTTTVDSNRVTNSAFTTNATGWSGAGNAFIATTANPTVSTGRMVITTTAAAPSGGARTTLTGTFRAGVTYTITMQVQGTAGAPIVALIGKADAACAADPSTCDYAYGSMTASGGVETLAFSWTPRATHASGIELAIRGNSGEPAARTLYVDDVSVLRSNSGVEGAIVTTSSGRRAVESGGGYYVFTLGAGSYTLRAATSDGAVRTDPGAPFVICDAGSTEPGCEAYTGPGSTTVQIILD